MKLDWQPLAAPASHARSIGQLVPKMLPLDTFVQIILFPEGERHFLYINRIVQQETQQLNVFNSDIARLQALAECFVDVDALNGFGALLNEVKP